MRASRWGLVLVVAFVAVAAVSSAQAAFPGENGKIAYSGGSGASTRHAVWSVNPDGTGATQLTQDGIDSSSYLPAWSKAGTRIAFASTRSISAGSRWEAEGMNADGSARTPITRLFESNLALLDKPSWSPDGTKLAIAAHPVNREFGICVRDFIWDYFDRQSCDVSIYTVNADGTGLTALRPGFYPAWSPQGDRIAFSAYRGATTEIYTMRPDGSDVRALTNNEVRDEEPEWSPDGSRLAFTSERVQQVPNFVCCSVGPGDIYSMAADGTDVRTLVTNGALDAAPAWSPDGTKIAFASTRRTPNCEPFGTFPCQSDIYEMNSDGSAPRVVAFFGHAPDWQPLNRPPDCSRAFASPATLSAPNRKLADVYLLVPDPDFDPVVVSVRGATQDEPTGGAPDAAAGTAPNQVRLRAERDTQGDGRVYRVSFDVSDGRGGTCSATVTVGVPKGAGAAVDSAPPSYNSFAP
jgi:Tol biopolymer transport system component